MRSVGIEPHGLPEDPEIPGLAAAARGELDEMLGVAGMPLPVESWRVLKHHPGARCTLRAEAAGRRVLVKAYRDDPSPLAQLMLRFREAGLATGHAPTVPAMLSFDPRARVMVTVFLDQEPCRDLIASARGDRAGRLAAAWIRAIAGSGIDAGRAYGVPELVQDAAGWADRLGRASPTLGRTAETLLGLLATVAVEGSPPRLVHGSYSHSHVFDLGTGPGVVDWDGFRQGPPELDAGRFLAGLSSLASGRRRLRDDAVLAGRTFTREIEDMVEGPALVWHRTAALLRLAYYASVRRPRRWESRAEELMAEGRSLLEAVG